MAMRDFAGENMSQEIQDFFTLKGVKSYFANFKLMLHNPLTRVTYLSTRRIEIRLVVP